MLRNLAVLIVEMAASTGNHTNFQRAADSFLVAANGKQPTQSNPFCQEWLQIGLMHAEGIKTRPDGYDIRNPDEMVKLAIAALEYTFGKDWQGHEYVSRSFDNKRNYKTPLGIRTWETMDRGERREVVRKALRGAARTLKRQSDKIRAKKQR
jgi:hypothetical protein